MLKCILNLQTIPYLFEFAVLYAISDYLLDAELNAPGKVCFFNAG